jgi:uncharacterized membrane protein SpoIIM required for sporulation
MNLDRFVQQRQPNWHRLEELAGRARKELRRLNVQELDELGQLYRGATADLALAQRDFPGQPVTGYLNQLVGQTHAVIYAGGPLRWRQVQEFYRCTFPTLYRSLTPYLVASFVLFFLPALVAFGAVWANPERIYVIEGPEIAGLVHEVEEGRLWTAIAPEVRSAAASLIMTNNIQVMFLTFAGGITAGVLSAWVMIQNGLHLGAIFGLLQAHGLSAGLAEFVVGHGVIELSVIIVAGACGLYMGDGLLRPGLLGRGAALTRRARRSVQVILGSVPFLVVAGLIEGFISPSGLPWVFKLGVGLLTGVLLYGYWLRVGRS